MQITNNRNEREAITIKECYNTLYTNKFDNSEEKDQIPQKPQTPKLNQVETVNLNSPIHNFKRCQKKEKNA